MRIEPTTILSDVFNLTIHKVIPNSDPSVITVTIYLFHSVPGSLAVYSPVRSR